MAISRAELLKELLPGLNELFGMEYKSYAQRQREAMGGNEYIHAARQIGDSKTDVQTSHEVHTQEARID